MNDSVEAFHAASHIGVKHVTSCAPPRNSINAGSLMPGSLHWLFMPMCPTLRHRCLLLMRLSNHAPHMQWWPGNLSFRDFVADLAGTAVATAAILALHRPQASSATLAGLASSLRPTAAPGAAAATAAPPKRAAYKALPAADIELGLASTADD